MAHVHPLIVATTVAPTCRFSTSGGGIVWCPWPDLLLLGCTTLSVGTERKSGSVVHDGCSDSSGMKGAGISGAGVGLSLRSTVVVIRVLPNPRVNTLGAIENISGICLFPTFVGGLGTGYALTVGLGCVAVRLDGLAPAAATLDALKARAVIEGVALLEAVEADLVVMLTGPAESAGQQVCGPPE